MDWEKRLLETLEASRPAYDEPPEWRSILALYDGLSVSAAHELDGQLVRMIDEDYRNPHASREQDPFEGVMTTLPAGMVPHDLLSIEAAVLVAAERKIGSAFFELNRLMRAPRWHAMYPRLQWLGTIGFDAQRALAQTEAGRTVGAILGLAAGDALGVTVEFRSRAQIAAAHPGGHREILGGGPFGFARGEWSDDTAMALAVAEGIIANPADPVDAVGERFVAWYAAGPPDVGATCRSAIEQFQQTASWNDASRRVAEALGDRAGGNGALMRTLPTAIAYGTSTDHAVAIARMTHPHPLSDAAVIAYHRAVDALIAGATKAEAFEVCAAHAGPLRDVVEAAPSRAIDAVRSSGYVVDTLTAALWAFMRTENLEDCIVQAVNLGDDADTVGAVAGGLAGACYGPNDVPRRWSLVLRDRDRLETAAEALYAIRRTHAPSAGMY